MDENGVPGCKGVYEGRVLSNRQIGPSFWKLLLEFSGAGAEAFGGSGPGQFAQLDLRRAALPPDEKIPPELADAARREILLRRPFSFTDVTKHGERVVADLLYCVVGPATLRMTTLKAKDQLSVVGPLGKGFWVPEGKNMALLVFGGMGVVPMQHIAKELTDGGRKGDIRVIAFAGAKTVYDLPFQGRADEISQQLGYSIREFARYGIESVVATDDGSAGYHGFVTDCFAEWLKGEELDPRGTVIYSCGPEPMMQKVAEIAAEQDIDCQVSLERRMACGTGLCQSCAIECRVPDSTETVYKLCCKDGPVFDAREVVFGGESREKDEAARPSE